MGHRRYLGCGRRDHGGTSLKGDELSESYLDRPSEG